MSTTDGRCQACREGRLPCEGVTVCLGERPYLLDGSSPPQQRKTQFVSVSVTLDGRDALRRMAANCSGALGFNVSISQALKIAEKLVSRNALFETIRECADEAKI